MHFFNAMMEKFQRVAKEKNRSLKPWEDYDSEFLLTRLREEWDELNEALLVTPFHKDEETLGPIKDELIDVTAFCCFLWLKLGGMK
jgi:NTP pyrophosphatase (non-canonical NTP hydrolase)